MLADWADIKLHLNNRDRPDVRHTAVVIVAGVLPLCACRARQLTMCDAARSRRTSEAIETGWLVTTTTSVAFATGRKQNIARKSDRHMATLGLQMMEQSRE